jgi:tetratricopeptide (TPR) repeat protein
MLGLEFPTRMPEIPFVRVQSERLLAGDRTELSKMLELMELDWDERWVERAGQLIDRWHHQTDRAFDPNRISRHEQTLRTARQLGYEPLDIDRAGLDRRYKLAYGRAEQRGPALGAYNFGILLEQCGDLEGAEAAYRRADEHGLAAGAYNFGVLLEERGEVEGAMAAYRRAIQSGDPEPAARASEALERLTG